MNPKPVPTRLVASHHLRRLRQLEALVSTLDRFAQRSQVPCIDGPLSRLLSKPYRETKLPLPGAQLHCQVEGWLLVTLLNAGCCVLDFLL